MGQAAPFRKIGTAEGDDSDSDSDSDDGEGESDFNSSAYSGNADGNDSNVDGGSLPDSPRKTKRVASRTGVEPVSPPQGTKGRL